ncbi:hypothetical protein XELAEV_18003815mg [Xenopus laevis]|nr:hypothetical protein XELAEV_18003815mg [Xenopus laevis]
MGTPKALSENSGDPAGTWHWQNASFGINFESKELNNSVYIKMNRKKETHLYCPCVPVIFSSTVTASKKKQILLLT